MAEIKPSSLDLIYIGVFRHCSVLCTASNNVSLINDDNKQVKHSLSESQTQYRGHMNAKKCLKKKIIWWARTKKYSSHHHLLFPITKK